MNSVIVYGVLFNGFRIFTGAFAIVYMLESGLSVTDVGLIKSFQAFVIFFLDIPLGYISDKKSRKLSIVLASICSAIWLLCMGSANSFSGFVLAEFFNSLSITLMGGAYNALLISHSKSKGDEPRNALRISHKWNHIGMFAFSLVGALLADVIGVSVWYVAGALMTATAFYGFVVLPKDSFSVSEDDNDGNNKSRIKDDFGKFIDILIENKHISLLFVSIALIFNLAAQYWQVVFKDKGIDVLKFELGITFSLMLLCQSFASNAVKRFPKNTNYLIASTLFFVSFGLIIIDTGFDKYIAIALTCLTFFSIRLLLLIVEIDLHEALEDKFRATYESFLSTVTRAALFISFPLFGYLIDTFGYVSLGWVFLLVVLVTYSKDILRLVLDTSKKTN